MITSSIKTNLILKEIGVTRYSLRSCKEKTNDKEVHTYQKGNILTLLKQSYNDLSKDEAKLLDAIIDAVNSANNQTFHNSSCLDNINEFISSCLNIKGIISFSSSINNIKSSIPFVNSSPLEAMISDKESKKILWKKLQDTIL